jgi:hypothetical protein
MVKTVMDQDVMPVLISRLAEWNHKQQELRKQVQRVVQSEAVRNYQGKRPLRPDTRDIAPKPASRVITTPPPDPSSVEAEPADWIPSEEVKPVVVSDAAEEELPRKASAERLVLDIDDEPVVPARKPKSDRGSRELATLLKDTSSTLDRIRRKAHEFVEHEHSKLLKQHEAVIRAAGVCVCMYICM